MAPQNTNAAQHAEPVQVPIDLSALNHLFNPEYYKPKESPDVCEDEDEDEDGTIEAERPEIHVHAILSNETEDYIRILKTLAEILPVYDYALKGTYYGAAIARERWCKVLHLLGKVREEIAHGMGVCIADRLSEWQDNYL